MGCRIYRRWLIRHLEYRKERIKRRRYRIKIAYDLYRYGFLRKNEM